jgi:signal transduction histidine kinase
LAENRGSGQRKLDLSHPVRGGGNTYFHAAVLLDRRAVGGGELVLHAFYPEAAWREARWQAVWPPLAIGAAAVMLVGAAAIAVARHVTQPIQKLRSQVERIAKGDFAPVPEPRRDDEIRDLAMTVNRMAERLARYETETRQSERLRTLGTLGGGIAHQIRNAATGCRIAIDLHERDCSAAAQRNAAEGTNGLNATEGVPYSANGNADEPLHVAARQLELIETHIQRFLTLGRASTSKHQPLDLNDVLADAVALIDPTAAHIGVRIERQPSAERLIVEGDRESLVQMLVNLLTNAAEAAARTRVTANAGRSPAEELAVTIQAMRIGSRCEISVTDPGPGPSPAIQSRLFEPFATDKPGGTGLGLVVSRQIAEDHGGSIRWERQHDPAGGRTRFIVTLPIRIVEAT